MLNLTALPLTPPAQQSGGQAEEGTFCLNWDRRKVYFNDYALQETRH